MPCYGRAMCCLKARLAVRISRVAIISSSWIQFSVNVLACRMKPSLFQDMDRSAPLALKSSIIPLLQAKRVKYGLELKTKYRWSFSLKRDHSEIDGFACE